MLQRISLGVYFPGTSLLHRLQARTKLLVLLWLFIVLLAANQRRGHYAPFAVVFALLLLAIALSGISPAQLWRRMWLLVLIAVIGSIPTLLFLQGKPIVTLGPYSATFAAARWTMLAYAALLAGYALWLAVPQQRLRAHWRRRWIRRITILLSLTVPVVLAVALVTRTARGRATFPVGPLVISDLGIWVVVTASTILLVFFALALLLTMTTSPVALVEATRLLLAPLRRVGAPVDDFTLMVLISLRFIPTLLDEADQLMKAQTARGADVVHGSPRERLQSMETWFVPLVQGALRRAGDLATALEARGYQADGRQTQLHEGRLRAQDWAALLVVIVVTVGALIP
jgi:energy-coupling factor transport system permease protein